VTDSVEQQRSKEKQSQFVVWILAFIISQQYWGKKGSSKFGIKFKCSNVWQILCEVTFTIKC